MIPSRPHGDLFVQADFRGRPQKLTLEERGFSRQYSRKLDMSLDAREESEDLRLMTAIEME